MIQLITDVVDQASDAGLYAESTQSNQLTTPIDLGLQDRVFRNRGGEWLSAHRHNEPSRRGKRGSGSSGTAKGGSGVRLFAVIMVSTSLL